MPNRHRIRLLVLVMTLVVAGVAATALVTSYRAGLRIEQARLVNIAESQARFLEAVARFDMRESHDLPGGPFQATLSQFLDANRKLAGMRKTGELALARREGARIRILFRSRTDEGVVPDSFPMGADLGEAQSRALSGESGVMVARDYRGRRVLAAYEPVGVYDLGIVAKMDLGEVRAPFARAGMLAVGTGILLTLLGSALFLRLSEPLLQAVKDSEQRYRLLAENTVDGIWVMDSDLRFTYVNPAVEPLLGYSPEEWVGSLLSDHCSEADFARARDAAAGMARDSGRRDSRIRMEMELFRRDGLPVPVEITARPLILPDGSLQFQGVTRDASGRKAREEEMRSRTEELEALFRAAPAAILQLDPQGKVMKWNPAAQRIFGWKEEEVRGKALPLVLPGSEREFEELRGRVLAGESFSGVELTRRRRDGTPVDVRLSAAPVTGDENESVMGIMAVLEDITEKRRADEALRESEAFIRAVMDNLPLGVAVNSVDPSVDFLYMNDNFPRLYRTTGEELADPDVFWEAAYEDPDFREKIRSRVLEDLASEDPDRRFWEDIPITRKGEDVTYISARNTPVPERGLMISTVWDVSDRKRAEEALRESEERYRRLAENSPDLIYRYRLKPVPGFEYVNPAATVITGFTPEDHYADPRLGFKLVHPEDRHLLEEVFQPGSPEHLQKTVTLRWVRKDGETIWIEQRNVPILDEGGEVAAIEGSARDVTAWVQTRQDLEAREAALAKAQRIAKLGSWALDPETGSGRWSREMFNLTGFPEDPGPPSHSRFLEWVHPEDRPGIEAMEEEVLRTGLTGAVEIRRDPGLGPVRWFEATAEPEGPSGESAGPLRGTLQDITAQKSMELALRTSEERYRSLFEGSHAVMFVIEPGSGRFLDANPAAVRFYGYSREAMLSMNVFDVSLMPEEQVKMAILDASARERGHLVFPHRLADGSVRIVETYFGPVRMEGGDRIFSIVHDVTSRVEAEEALERREELLQAVVDHMPVMMVVFDEDQGWRMVNRCFRETLGWSLEEARSRPDLMDQIYPDAREQERAWKMIEEGDGTWGDFQSRTRDGRVLDTAWANVRLADGSVLGIGQDITERKLMERTLRDMNAILEARVAERTGDLREANRELEAFSYTVSHDLKAPLRAIDGFSRILEKDHGNDLDEEGRRLLGVIRTNAIQMAHLINDLLAFSRLGRTELRRTRVDLGALVESVLEDLRPEMEGRSVNLVVGDLPDAWGDRFLLRQVFLNLLSNAFKFTSTREEARILLGGRKEGSDLVVQIQDNGVGFDPDYAHKLFEAFQRLHHADEFPGSGVGLANVRRIVERHGGRVWAEGKMEAGATFYFTIPADSKEME